MISQFGRGPLTSFHGNHLSSIKLDSQPLRKSEMLLQRPIIIQNNNGRKTEIEDDDFKARLRSKNNADSEES